MNGKRCGDCQYFVAFRNMNYETYTCDTITEYCELLQNEDTYDRDKGDEIWNDVFDDCPLNKGYVSAESAIRLLQSKKEVCKQFDDYVRISCEKKKELQDENEQLRHEIEIEEKWQLEKDKYYAKIKEENEELEKDKMEALSLWGEEIDKNERLQKENNILNNNEDDLKECTLENIQLKEENEQLRTQLLLCKQSKDGRFQVWEVPPITIGTTISFSTNGDKK